jgi:hypothetical protein
MKNQFIFTTILLLLLSITQVFGYLGERHSPFIVSFDKKSSSSSLLEFKRGDTIQINWYVLVVVVIYLLEILTNLLYIGVLHRVYDFHCMVMLLLEHQKQMVIN